jgi:flagellin
VDAINTAMTGNNDIVASANSDGELVLVSASGQNIIFDDGSENGDLFTAAAGDDGVANASLTAGVGTAFGIITLTSDDGSQITLSDGEGPTHTGLDTLGLQGQSEKVDSTTTGLDVGSVANASAAITAIDTAIETVSSFRAGFGATENRLDKAINNLTTYKVNLEAAKGRIEDADFASETAALTKSQILNQAATSMLAQANASKQNLLALLQ